MSHDMLNPQSVGGHIRKGVREEVLDEVMILMQMFAKYILR